MDNGATGGFEADEWNVVFHRTATNRWLSMLAMGTFKHVSAFAYIPGHKVWLLYDAHWGGLRLSIVSHDTMLANYEHMVRDCEVIMGVKRVFKPMRLSSRFCFTCVTTVKHLLGLSCIAITPDQLHRYLLKRQEASVGPVSPAPPG